MVLGILINLLKKRNMRNIKTICFVLQFVSLTDLEHIVDILNIR